MFAANLPNQKQRHKMKLLIITLSIACSSLGLAAPVARPSDAHLHAYKAYHHAIYLKVTAKEAGGTNKLLHTTELPTEGKDPIVTPALDHLYTKVVIDLTAGPVVVELPKVDPADRYFSIQVMDQEHYTIYDEIQPSGKKRMPAASFLNGHPIGKRETLG